MPLYPDITLQLSGEDGNALSILGCARRAATEAGLSLEERDKFQQEALSGDYDHLLQTCMKWFAVL
ncbi:MAG: hypothetical protein DI628_03580 [Blastochloris viridis]|uniref:Uncharacterized protein n=1 Tax=Blastochloris viridis TaxID=1079 RepID=A0A6N4RDB2_BLAVI|nr:MAG: hypothetical protein DI628_03580 [Blastochloris viridis]